MLKKVPLINDGCYIIIPMGSIIAMLMVIYLAVSIGEDKKLNYFDKIPLEIVGFVAIIISVIPFIFLSDYFYSTGNDYVGGISIIITVALFIYVIACVCMITFIRRLKAKSFWKTTIIGKIFYWFKDVLLKYNVTYCIGGNSRQESVSNAVKVIDACDLLIIHDGARPLVTANEIKATLKAAMKYGAAAVGVPVKDTIKVIDKDNKIIDTPERSSLIAIQTPQIFKFDKYVSAMNLATEQGKDFTDDCKLLENMNESVYVVIGEYSNIKITTPEDIPTAVSILNSRGEK